MAERTPYDNTAGSHGGRSVHASSILFGLAIALLLLGVIVFAVEAAPKVIKIASTPEIGSTASPTATEDEIQASAADLTDTATPSVVEPATPTAPPATPTAAIVTPAPPLATPTRPPATPTAPPATPTAVETEWVDYIVRPGDTLATIAAHAGIDVATLAEMNSDLPNKITAGTVLVVPARILTPVARLTPIIKPIFTPKISPTPAATATATPTDTASPTATASATPTDTATPSPTVTEPPTPTFTATATATAIPIPIGRFAMGFPLTMTVGGQQVVYVQITTSATETPADAGGGDTGVAARIRVAVGQPDVVTEIVRDVRIFPNMGAVLDAPSFTVHASGPVGAEAPDWRSLQDGSALWLWTVSPQSAGRQLLTVQMFGRQGPADAPEDVLFEVQAVTVMAEPIYASVWKSEVVRSTGGPLALLLAVVMASGGLFMRRKERLTRPVKGLPGIQVKQLQGALLSAFDSKESLEQMVRIQLDQNLAVISTGENLADIVYDLIRWAEANGQVERLVRGALAENPGNAELQQVAKQWPGGGAHAQA